MEVVYLVFILFVTTSVALEEECEKTEKPSDLKLKEEYCWTEEVEVVDRIVQTSKNVLNFAKKKLGIGVVEDDTKQKCEYYFCLLRQLHLLNANDYPAYEYIQDWTKKNVIYIQAVRLMEQLDKCNEALTNSTIREINFYADHVDKPQSSDEVTDDKVVPKNQTTCDIAAEFIDCLSRQKDCPVFHYP